MPHPPAGHQSAGRAPWDVAAIGTPFSMALDVDGGTATLTLCGELDLLTAPTAAGALESLVGQWYDEVVVDLVGVTHIGAQGLRLIAAASSRMQEAGGVLTIRSGSRLIRSLLLPIGVNAGLDADEPSPPEAPSAVNSERDESTDTIVAAGLGSSDPQVIEAALQLVAALARATVVGRHGVSVALDRQGRLATMRSSREPVPSMAHGSPGDPDDQTDGWAGHDNVHPITEAADGAPREQELADLMAANAPRFMTKAGNADRREITRWITTGMQARQVIARAEGVYMARRHLPADEAAMALFRSARAGGVPVLAEALEVLASTHSSPPPAPEATRHA